MPQTRPAKFRTISIATLVAGFALAGCAQNQPEEETQDQGESVEIGGEGAQPDDRIEPYATAEIMNPDDEAVAHVEFHERDGGQTEVTVTAENLDPGFYGFHIHAIGECEPDSADPEDAESTGDFMSASGHLTDDESEEHPDHAGDMPALLVNEDGTATMAFRTDRIDESLLMDEDGSAVMIHSEADNYANIPERYLDDDQPDADTLNTGDAGERLACGVIE